MGQIGTHFNVDKSPNKPYGQVYWQRLVVSSAKMVGETVGHVK